jgi:AcrR family transcriptional regulator
MARWEPDGRRRLEEAAFALYAERGFEQTTVAEIAERAGLTERTFFRHFADKREVLFAGASALQEALVTAVESAPGSLAPIDAAAAGIEAIAALLPERATAQRRQAIIAANAELRERELIKLASLSWRSPTRSAGAGSQTPPQASPPRSRPRCSESHSSAGFRKATSENCPSSSTSHSTT